MVYRKDMKISWLAKFLSRFAIQHNSAGIGVGEVCKMQFAIDECGAWKVLWAAICAGFGKLVGKHGIFYDMVGMEVTGLDGFYPDVFPVYGDYGIRIPENPSGVCNEIYEKTGVRAMIVDANDFTRDILGKGDNVTLTDEQLCEIIRDNPAGQDDQCTPFYSDQEKTVISPAGEACCFPAGQGNGIREGIFIFSKRDTPPLHPPRENSHCKRAARRAAMLADCTAMRAALPR